MDCSCSPSVLDGTAKSGACPSKCNTLLAYIIIFSITVLIHSTSEVGSMLLTLRCVEPQDKAMALGFISFAIGLFGTFSHLGHMFVQLLLIRSITGNVPCPIIFGTVIDTACLFWEQSCGKQGACRIYDTVDFRHRFHGLTAFIMFLALCIDLVVCYKASSIQFHDDIPPPQPAALTNQECNLNKSENDSSDNTLKSHSKETDKTESLC